MREIRKTRRAAILAACSVAVGLGMSGTASAETKGYPASPITIVVPFAPGGASDMTARLIGEQLGERLKQTVIVENRAGANSQIGTSSVVRAQPDGYTLLLGTTSLVNNPFLYKNLPYDAATQLRPVVGLVDVPAFLTVGSKLNVKSAQEFLGVAKKNNGALNYSSAGMGSTLHLAAEWLKDKAGIDAAHIPQRGSGPSVVAVASGEVDFSMENYGPAKPQIDAGRLSMLAVASPARFPALPDVPTFKEAGLPDVDLSSWFVLMAPADTPDSVVNLLNEHVNAVLARPEIKERLVAIGLVPLGGSADDMRKRMDNDAKQWGDIIRSADIKVE
ncbi:Bug family tripartite tricarboxylate transporter substrate binding protein [Paracandidimonas soli]|uniref:Tripartite-type tricarboxylate transporter receptor subunit TctC n=1 Tax=Paracandidimonas soli TaxID=1917182 RepID=A0A4R3V1B0_9BURK|nr:tripartite tricarboxylate transporter substrate binding protein [Paracandidimonas soli]TCU96054.1 tripartite-type tricarboxylate transporter receptor subunit TctC [Paracandidimonas soli]